MVIEIFMLIQLVKMYEYELDLKAVFIILTLLFTLSVVLSFVVGDLVAILSLMLFAPIVKPVVAAVVIWGLGEGTIYILERYGE